MPRPEKVLRNNPYAAPSFFFPANIGNEGEEPYTIFDIREAVAHGGKSKGTIALPMPKELTTQYHADYENVSIESDFFLTDQEARDIVNRTGSSWQTIFNAIPTAREMTTAVINTERAQRDFGVVVNPHMSILFRGIGFRTFNLSYDLFPKTPSESDMINDIIYTFKYHMHPSVPEGDPNKKFFYYPENFVIAFFSPEDHYLFKVSTCVLQDCNVNYSPSGPSFFHRTGAPTMVSINLVFTENEILTKERVAQGY